MTELHILRFILWTILGLAVLGGIGFLALYLMAKGMSDRGD